MLTGSPTLTDVLDHWLMHGASRWSPATLATHGALARKIAHRIGHLPVTAVDAGTIAEFPER